MAERIDHIGIAVKSIDEATSFYVENLGLEVKETEIVKEQKVKVATIPVGESKIELLESTDPGGPIAKHIEKRGEGIQHVAIRVSNIEETLGQMKDKGIRLIDEEPWIGAGGAKAAFVHPKSTRGVLLELVER